MKILKMAESDGENLLGWCDSEFWKVDCVYSIIVLPNLILWLFALIPMYPYLCTGVDHKKWYWNPLNLRYFAVWIIIISMVITESHYSTIQSCQCICVYCFIRISVYIYIFIVWFWFLYKHELKFEVEYECFKNFYTHSQAQAYFTKLHLAKPIITFTAQNYIMETVETDEGLSEERNDTCRFDQTYIYNHKIPEDLQTLSIDGVTRVKLTKGFVFENDALKYDHYAKYHEFTQRSKVSDNLMDVKEEIYIPDFQDRILVIPDGSDIPFWLNKTYFWMAKFLFLSLPYQWLFKQRTKKAKYHIKKILVSLET